MPEPAFPTEQHQLDRVVEDYTTQQQKPAQSIAATAVQCPSLEKSARHTKSASKTGQLMSPYGSKTSQKAKDN